MSYLYYAMVYILQHIAGIQLWACSYSCGLAGTAVGSQLSAGAKFCAFCECTHKARHLEATDDFSLIGYTILIGTFNTGCLKGYNFPEHSNSYT